MRQLGFVSQRQIQMDSGSQEIRANRADTHRSYAKGLEVIGDKQSKRRRFFFVI